MICLRCRGPPQARAAQGQDSHAPVPVTGRQCHTQPDLSCSAPVFSVTCPYSRALVSDLLASFSNVVMMSETVHAQSSMFASCFLHSSHASSLVGSVSPAPLGSRARKREAASTAAKRVATAARRNIPCFVGQ